MVTMQRIGRYAALALLAIALVSATGCARKPTEAEMQALEMQIKAADDAEARITELEAEKARLERELQSAKQELSDHQAEFQVLKQRKPTPAEGYTE
jgi:Skp family chaperone for outer membrane proteins